MSIGTGGGSVRIIATLIGLSLFSGGAAAGGTAEASSSDNGIEDDFASLGPFVAPFREGPGPEALYDADQGEPEALVEPQARGTLFPSVQPPWRQALADWRKTLYDEYGLTFFASYQQSLQYATAILPSAANPWAVGGWFALGGTWTPVDRDGDYQGSLVLRTGWRGPIGDNPWPAVFGPTTIGSAWSSYEFTNWGGGIAIEDLFWEQRLGPDFSFRIGNQAPQATLNTFRFKDARTGFSASPLAFSETIPYPAFGPGFSFRWNPVPGTGFYINGAVNDMNGNPGQFGFDWSHISADQLFLGAEIGHMWRRPNGEFDLLAINFFHAGTRDTFNPDTSPNAPGWGFKINGEKQWGQIVGFSSYTYNTARGGGISATFSGNTAYLGAAYLSPFDISGEIALAALWTQPFENIFPGSGQRDQYGLESYWNIALTPNSTLTPGVQLIANPSFNPDIDFVALPRLNFRVFF